MTMAASRRRPRVDGLLRSWKLAHRRMTQRADPYADMIAADIAKLENDPPASEGGLRGSQDERAAGSARSGTWSPS
jgi:hypothetical protein